MVGMVIAVNIKDFEDVYSICLITVSVSSGGVDEKGLWVLRDIEQCFNMAQGAVEADGFILDMAMWHR